MANAPFPIPAHRTGHADFRHPALRLASPQGTRRGSERRAFEAQQAEFSVDNVAREPLAAAPCHPVPSGEEVAHALIDVSVNPAEDRRLKPFRPAGARQLPFATGSRPATLALPSSWSTDQQGPAQAFIRLARRSPPAASRSTRPIFAAMAIQGARAISITPNSSTTTSKTSSPRSRQCNQGHGLCWPAFPVAGALPCMPLLYLSDGYLCGLC